MGMTSCLLLVLYFNQVVSSESRKSPFILFMKDAEKSMVGNSESYTTFKSKLEKLPDNVVVIGSHTHADNRKEKVSFLWKSCVMVLPTYLTRNTPVRHCNDQGH